MIKKLISIFGALLVISIVTFVLVKLSSANPAEQYLRLSKISITPEALHNARLYLGLDKPLWEQYLTWLSDILVGNFGTSYLLKVPVLPLVVERFFATLMLSLTSFLLVLVIAFPLGIVSGLFEHSLFDRLVRLFSFVAVSMPSFWLGYLLIIAFSVKLNLLPVSGKVGASSLILPSITLSFSLIGQYTALIRKAISEQLTSLHVENARLRGVKTYYIVKHHLIRNAFPAIATGLSLTFVYLMTGSIIVEDIFSWNGIGSLFVMSLKAADIPVIQACMLLFGALFLLHHVITQELVSFIDPRLRKTKEEACPNT
ncbi:TPA: ABC transporter permease [Streptococcus equi subsp. zooepidemicus]|nr:ABC transporter permease [Streptococcus equi subsp. zooepidemicus]HEL0174957.1 ABC transporter permease [Streptococcus equi subsp. zooepidemicus]HEL0189102.1 ABC transporter permease [Streptococcus equi subsp. zooepidemicus]HEL0215044.1 ABC transporter permease [Streptococcus equi subsp. zooepidemicus]HEL0252892.1 ABC transporter permease [Streptococcus equi subsp. zooepidemicus]